MPHTRERSAKSWIQKLASFWPAVGVLGLRQVGKTTLLRDQLGIRDFFSFDDEDTRAFAEASAKVFLAQLNPPAIIDEVQKVPKVFDALKALIDRKKIPGQFYLTGSSQFSAKIGIRESLAGRIGLLQLYPLTLGELHRTPGGTHFLSPLHSEKLRFQVEHSAAAMKTGGMPVPAFLRDPLTWEIYWKSWLDAMVYRDVGRVFGKNYDPELAMDILKQYGKTLREGEVVTFSHFKVSARKLRPYFEAMETVFILKRFRCHEAGVGKDFWMLGDSGLANYLMGPRPSPGVSLSSARHFILNEILAQNEYAGKSLATTYYKSAKGSLVDFVWDGVPIKILEESHSSMGWQERALAGAMKKLNSQIGIIVSPNDHIQLPKNKKGIAYVPWSYWS
jgi:predicted AAA+ superfamily ATPase